MSILTEGERKELGLNTLTANKIDDVILATDIGKIPCSCYACDEGVHPGHFACERPPAWARNWERVGKIVRHYGHPDDDRFDAQRWFWEVC